MSECWEAAVRLTEDVCKHHQAGRFDVAIITGRSGMYYALELQRQGIPVVEVYPFRMEGSPAKLIDEDIAGKRCALVDDWVHTGGTIEYVRSAVIEAGGLFVAAFIEFGDLNSHLLTSEVDRDDKHGWLKEVPLQSAVEIRRDFWTRNLFKTIEWCNPKVADQK